MSEPAPVAPPGWYPDTRSPGYLRWFDGQGWTGYVHVAPGWAPGWAASGAPDPNLKWLLPVNRSPLAIAAGYAGLFSVLLVFAPISLILGVLALRSLSHQPTVGGRGRAWFGVVAGALGSIGLGLALLS